MLRNFFLAQLSKGFNEQSLDGQRLQIGMFTRIVYLIFFNTQFHFIQKQFSIIKILTTALSVFESRIRQECKKNENIINLIIVNKGQWL